MQITVTVTVDPPALGSPPPPFDGRPPRPSPAGTGQPVAGRMLPTPAAIGRPLGGAARVGRPMTIGFTA